RAAGPARRAPGRRGERAATGPRPPGGPPARARRAAERRPPPGPGLSPASSLEPALELLEGVEDPRPRPGQLGLVHLDHARLRGRSARERPGRPGAPVRLARLARIG